MVSSKLRDFPTLESIASKVLDLFISLKSSYNLYIYLWIMNKKASDFDDFLIATILADLFDPSGSDDLEFVSKKIVDGLIDNGIMKNEDFEDEENIAA